MMDKKERQELIRSFWRHFKENLSGHSRDKWLTVIFILAFLSVLSAIAALLWLY